jgi:ferritin-like metal-binding protein YciE
LEVVMRLQTLNDLFVEELGDLYSAEPQLVPALPKMVAAASHDQLKQASEQHLGETHDHVQRLEEIFGRAGMPPRRLVSACRA